MVEVVVPAGVIEIGGVRGNSLRLSGTVPAVAPSVVMDASVMLTSVTSVIVGDEVEGMFTTCCPSEEMVI